MVRYMRVRQAVGSICAAMLLLTVAAAAPAQQPAAGSVAFELDAIPLGPVSDLPSRWFARYDGAIVPEDLSGAKRNVIVSDTGRRVELVTGKGSRQFVYIDGQKGPEYQEIVTHLQVSPTEFQPSFLISADQERLAYVARKAGNRFVVVVDQVESPEYDKVLFIQFAPAGHRLIYVAQRGPKQFLVDDGKEGPSCDNVDLNQILFSPDGQRLAYLCGIRATGELASHANNGDFWRIVIDGRPSPACFGISLITFSDDSRHLAFVAATGSNRVGSSNQIVFDGVAGRKYWLIRGEPERETVDGRVQERFRLPISGDGAHVAFISAKEPPNTHDTQEADLPHFVVIDDKEGTPFEHVRNIVISPDGRRIVYIADNHENGRVTSHLVENGQPGSDYDQIGAVLFSPDSKKLIYFANSRDKGLIVIDGQESDCNRDFYDSISPVIFSKDGQHMAYLDREEHDTSKVVVVLDGKRFPVSGVGGVRQRRIEFLPDDRHVACYAFDSSTQKLSWSVVGDSDDGAAQLAEMVFSRDGKHVAKVVAGKLVQMQQRDGSGRMRKFNWPQPPQLSIDGKPQTIDCSAIGKVCLSDDGKHYACAVYGAGDSRRFSNSGSTRDAGYQIDFDGRLGPVCKKIIDLALSPDGRHLAYVADDGSTATEAGKQHVVVDSVGGLEWQGMIPSHAPPHDLAEDKFPEFLEFFPDGSLRFLAARNGMLYRCRYRVATLDQMPSFELASMQALPPTAATAPETFAELMDKTRDANRRASEAYMAKNHENSMARSQESNNDLRERERQRKQRYANPLGGQELFAFNPANSERQGSDLTGFVLVGDSLYGVNRSGGRNGDGVLFKLSLDGADFSAIHYFDRQTDGSSPASLIAAPDGTLYGMCSKAPAADSSTSQNRFLRPQFNAAAVFHYDPKTDALTVLDKTVGSTAANPTGLSSGAVYPGSYSAAPQSSTAICLISQDRSIFGICGPKPTQIFHMGGDGKEMSMLKNSKDWQAFVDGGDGYFYGSNWDGLAKIKYDGSEQTTLHKFAGGDNDGDAAVGAPVLLGNAMFGYASASPLRAVAGDAPPESARPNRRSPEAAARQGVLYRINRDGTDYAILDDTIGDPHANGPLVAADDGSAAYGLCPRGLFKISAAGGQPAMLSEIRGATLWGSAYRATLRAARGNWLYCSSEVNMYATPAIFRLATSAVELPTPVVAKPAPHAVETVNARKPQRAEPAMPVQPEVAANPSDSVAPGQNATVTMTIFKPLPLVVDPMQWSPAPK